MTGLQQRLLDIKLVLSTDRRIWAAAGFIGVVVMVWSLTTTWREPVPEIEAYPRKQRQQEEHLRLALTDFQTYVQKDKENSETLREIINRTANELETNKETIDWHVNTLVEKLDTMTSRVDQIARQVGERRVERAKLDERLARQKKNAKKIRKVDPAEL